jgi:hypothetical protein
MLVTGAPDLVVVSLLVTMAAATTAGGRGEEETEDGDASDGSLAGVSSFHELSGGIAWDVECELEWDEGLGGLACGGDQEMLAASACSCGRGAWDTRGLTKNWDSRGAMPALWLCGTLWPSCLR